MLMHSKALLHAISWGISLSAGLTAVVLDESTGFSLGVIFVVFSGIWWLGRKLQNIEDRLATAQEWREEVRRRLENVESDREEMRTMLNKLVSKLS